jgi:hypothetical protein
MLSEITVAGTGDRSNPAIKRSLSPGRNISRSSEPADLRSDSEYSGYRTAILLSADSASITNDPLSVFGWYPGIHSHLSVPIDLEPYGATERRTLQSLPAKNGTADLVIGSGNAHSNEEGGTSADTRAQAPHFDVASARSISRTTTALGLSNSSKTWAVLTADQCPPTTIEGDKRVV